MLKPEYLRWLYTALTRAQQQAYLLGFGPAFFEPGHEPYIG
jgi:ATP-dependent exoDNAse (exonuclease V) beta subunit